MKHAGALSLLLLWCSPALAEVPLLTVTGPAGSRTYDQTALEALGPQSFTTSTIWTVGEAEFTGVPLRTLLDDAGISDGAVLATAINDYTIEIPVADITEQYPIVAYLVDGKPMSVRDKGPLWVVYPYDSSPDLQSEVIYSRSIWQLDRLAVHE